MTPTNKQWKQQCVLEKNDHELVQQAVANSKRAERALILVSLMTIIFVIIELCGGWIAHSLAVLADGFHMFSDLCTLILSIIAIKMSRKSENGKYTFGFQRAEVLGAVFSILTIWLFAAFLVYIAALRIFYYMQDQKQLDVDADLMMITACIGIVFNILIGISLHFAYFVGNSSVDQKQKERKICAEDGNNSSSCSSASSTISTSTPKFTSKNLNIRAAFVNAAGDLLQSIGVLLAGVIIKFTGFTLADPLCTFVFAFIVLCTTMPTLRDSILILMESSPCHEEEHQKIVESMLSIPGVVGVHSLRVWALNSDTRSATVHLELVSMASPMDMLKLDDNAMEIILNLAHTKLTLLHGIRFPCIQFCTTSHA